VQTPLGLLMIVQYNLYNYPNTHQNITRLLSLMV
jgi:hypothetical protein